MNYTGTYFDKPTWLVKIVWKEEQNNGKMKSITSTYLFESNSIKDIEEEIKEMFDDISSDYQIQSITNASIKAIFRKS